MPLSRQIYLELPDGQLDEYSAELKKSLEGVASGILPQRIFTLGAMGFDGHADHIATHVSALSVAKDLREAGQETVVWALTHDQESEYFVVGNLPRKLGSMAMHISQTTGPDLLNWGGTDFYRPVILGPEAYDIV